MNVGCFLSLFFVQRKNKTKAAELFGVGRRLGGSDSDFGVL
jgi:hypothetical protein